MLHWEHVSKFNTLPAFACKMGSKFLLLHLFGFSSSVFSYINSNYKCRECWGFLPFRQEKDSLGQCFSPALVPGLLLPQSRSTVGSPSPLRRWSLQSSFYFTLGRESSALLVENHVTASGSASLWVCCFPLFPLLQGHQNHGLCYSCHLKKTLWISQREKKH